MAEIRVLIVDDHAIVRQGIRNLISSMDDSIHIVDEATNGAEALQKVEELSPDVVVMDIMMPRMDGLEATKRIQKQNPQAKVIILTQHDDMEYVLSSIKSGARGVVPKYALPTDLVSAIHTVYEGNAFLYPSMAAKVVDNIQGELQETADGYEGLSDREKEIFRLVAEGHKDSEIAEFLIISAKTVRNHIANVAKKLDVPGRNGIFRYAIRKKMIDL